MYEVFEQLLQKHNVTSYKVSKKCVANKINLIDAKMIQYFPSSYKLWMDFCCTTVVLQNNQKYRPIFVYSSYRFCTTVVV